MFLIGGLVFMAIELTHVDFLVYFKVEKKFSCNYRHKEHFFLLNYSTEKKICGIEKKPRQLYQRRDGNKLKILYFSLAYFSYTNSHRICIDFSHGRDNKQRVDGKFSMFCMKTTQNILLYNFLSDIID